MISTVTTTTVTTVTTATMAGSLVLIAVLVLFGLLIQKEIASGSNSPKLRRLATALNIGIYPLAIAFVLSAISKVALVLK